MRLASPSELARGSARGQLLQSARGVPVTDSNAAVGMLVRRSYDFGTLKENTDKALMCGVLVKRVRATLCPETLQPTPPHDCSNTCSLTMRVRAHAGLAPPGSPSPMVKALMQAVAKHLLKWQQDAVSHLMDVSFPHV